MTETAQNDAPARSPLTATTVVDAALALADRQGMEAVTIRKLANQLGVTPMAIYWHVRNKDELLDRVAARILEQVDLPGGSESGWRGELRALLGQLLGVLRAHPEAAQLVSTRTVSTPPGMKAAETLLDILRRAGFSPTQATQVARHALSTLTSLVGDVPGTVASNETPAQKEAREHARQSLEALPPERFPRLIEASGPLSECEDPDAYFAFGLDLLVAGIEAMAPREASV